MRQSRVLHRQYAELLLAALLELDALSDAADDGTMQPNGILPALRSCVCLCSSPELSSPRSSQDHARAPKIARGKTGPSPTKTRRRPREDRACPSAPIAKS